ncbi:KH domain-containing protein [Methanopyrus kandleri]|uniref:Predicted RNA-binding protein containing KH domain n=1 Tax=Methanopyrus kandleri (strain AV19 / DSM 6324 / JCM 9639 / NBRC 100938) TaxID=190192 RepID=Q8TH62_METKA|nr:KH domain-containing protein [Methanopyrus kandleri]AAM01728.1 Predicted RNA-binding protein containing KH domain) [Methanopyrus kandleri AV19]
MAELADEFYESAERVKIPKDRIGVLIGKDGETKRYIEEKTGVELRIDSKTGEVEIRPTERVKDPLDLIKAKECVLAIGRGFSPERAFRLLREEDASLEVIDLYELVGRNPKALERQRARIIGREGRTRQLIEELSGADVSIRGKTVALIGTPRQLQIARKAIEMLASGAPHGRVYRFLEDQRRKMKREKLRLWKDSEPPDIL